jgi:hypothetical protein
MCESKTVCFFAPWDFDFKCPAVGFLSISCVHFNNWVAQDGATNSWLFFVQFDALVAALPLSEGGEEAQLKRIAELQVYSTETSLIYTFYI